MTMVELKVQVAAGWEQTMPWLGTLGFREVTPGDTKLQWDTDNDAEVAAAEATFKALRGKGYTAFAVDARGRATEQLTRFPEDAGALILKMVAVPAIAGG